MKLNSKLAVSRVLSEGITDFDSLSDFDKESLKALAKNCTQDILKVTADQGAGIEAEPAIKGTCISTVSSIRLLTACNAVKYYKLVSRTPNLENMSYTNVLSKFQVDWEHHSQTVFRRIDQLCGACNNFGAR